MLDGFRQHAIWVLNWGTPARGAGQSLLVGGDVPISLYWTGDENGVARAPRLLKYLAAVCVAG
jgi:hypothetical protein